MDYVEVRNVVQEEASLPTKHRAVYCGCGASLVVPSCFSIMRQHGIRMMQIRNADKPVGHQEPWNTVIPQDGASTEYFRCLINDDCHACQASIG